ncbi:hypothetical protein DFH06DRAFT_1130467 [Mycena polygramma]|nr:hypothetical protein DFH06DRAFT_1130467 [Mycena polygramma]
MYTAMAPIWIEIVPAAACCSDEKPGATRAAKAMGNKTVARWADQGRRRYVRPAQGLAWSAERNRSGSKVKLRVWRTHTGGGPSRRWNARGRTAGEAQAAKYVKQRRRRRAAGVGECRAIWPISAAGAARTRTDLRPSGRQRCSWTEIPNQRRWGRTVALDSTTNDTTLQVHPAKFCAKRKPGTGAAAQAVLGIGGSHRKRRRGAEDPKTGKSRDGRARAQKGTQLRGQRRGLGGRLDEVEARGRIRGSKGALGPVASQKRRPGRRKRRDGQITSADKLHNLGFHTGASEAGELPRNTVYRTLRQLPRFTINFRR